MLHFYLYSFVKLSQNDMLHLVTQRFNGVKGENLSFVACSKWY